MTAAPARGVAIAGLATALPPLVVTNADLEARLDTTDAWITERSGIRERRIGGTTGGLAIEAGAKALAAAGLVADDIDLLILATETPDALMPSTSAAVAGALGLRCGSFDLNAACAGFVYALAVASQLVVGGTDRILLIGADTMSSITDQEERTTAVLFGDGAAALVLEATPDPEAGVVGWDAGTDGTLRDILYCEHGSKIQMQGPEVFKKAVRVVTASCERALEAAKVNPADIDLFVPHQANLRIIDAAARRLEIPEDRWAVVLDTTGNTSAGSIPLALAKVRDEGRLADGTLLLLSGFGAGMTWASLVLRWAGRATP
jgi:3-oxoacyl-[acyl-carrier-protein] synthase-3